MAGRIIHSVSRRNATHRLYVRKIDGQPGSFTSMGTYCEPSSSCTGWDHNSICPGPKTSRLGKTGTHVIHVVVSFDRQKPDACEVVSELSTPNGPEVLRRRLKNNATGADHVEIRMEVDA